MVNVMNIAIFRCSLAVLCFLVPMMTVAKSRIQQYQHEKEVEGGNRKKYETNEESSGSDVATEEAEQEKFHDPKNVILSGLRRKVSISIENLSKKTWSPINIYYYSGESDQEPPKQVEDGETLEYNARDKRGWPTGVVGVLAYSTGDGKTLAVMFSVAFDYNLYSNWWNVKVYEGRKRAGYRMYKSLYYAKPFKGDNGWYERSIGNGLNVKGAMSSSGKATLKIRVSAS